MSRDSTGRVLAVAFFVCLVCSIMVSVAAVGLKNRQERNKEIEKKRNILQIANIYDPAKTVEELFQGVQVRIADLEKGRIATGVTSEKQTLEQQSIPADKDRAGIKSRPRYVEVYLVTERGKLKQLVLPVYGKGLWSTMYGFIALDADLSTVTGFGFYEHGETPGLGGEIDNPLWRAKWPGKKVYDQNGKVRIEVAKGSVTVGSADAQHMVDGLSGATLTARGVSGLLSYWLGENGYQPLLHNMRKSGGATP